MAFEAYASFKGKKQGQLKGESQKAHRSDKWTEVLSFEMGSEVPVDAKGGRPKGPRTQKPVVITKQIGSASPQLLQAHWTNEVLSEVIIEILLHVHVQKRITLTNAIVARFHRSTILSSHNTGKRNTNELEQFSFTYGKILVENLATGTSTTDDWNANNS
jgi:type VI secretion system Hcp family effector